MDDSTRYPYALYAGYDATELSNPPVFSDNDLNLRLFPSQLDFQEESTPSVYYNGPPHHHSTHDPWQQRVPHETQHNNPYEQHAQNAQQPTHIPTSFSSDPGWSRPFIPDSHRTSIRSIERGPVHRPDTMWAQNPQFTGAFDLQSQRHYNNVGWTEATLPDDSDDHYARTRGSDSFVPNVPDVGSGVLIDDDDFYMDERASVPLGYYVQNDIEVEANTPFDASYETFSTNSGLFNEFPSRWSAVHESSPSVTFANTHSPSATLFQDASQPQSHSSYSELSANVEFLSSATQTPQNDSNMIMTQPFPSELKHHDQTQGVLRTSDRQPQRPTSRPGHYNRSSLEDTTIPPPPLQYCPPTPSMLSVRGWAPASNAPYELLPSIRSSSRSRSPPAFFASGAPAPSGATYTSRFRAISFPETTKNYSETKRRPILACLSCRERKIACGRPAEENEDQTCNQCRRRQIPCEYPKESLRGHPRRLMGKNGGSAGVGVSGYYEYTGGAAR
ncbi:hypothetical protein FPV67DRAFT_157402 [Lyophyllum atratum]|nr:hypothetical protein FPV67DRAFT_157402 [Lyophyllum atratum]